MAKSSGPTRDADAWCCIEIDKNFRFTYCWTVKDFTQFAYQLPFKKYIDSKPFSVMDDGRTWRLRLYPKGDHFIDCPSLYLVLMSGTEVSATFYFSILNDEGKNEQVYQTNSPVTFVNHSPRGAERLICKCTPTSPNYYMHSCKYTCTMMGRFLKNDTLTIFCEVTIVTSPHYTSGQRKLEHPLKQVQNDLSQLLLDNQEFSDVILSVDGQELKAHRAILAARSPVFSAMFKNEMVEKNQNRVVITDLSHDTVVEMLRFMYTGNAQSTIPPKNLGTTAVAELLKAADKYQLEGLHTLCQDVVASNIRTNKRSSSSTTPTAKK